MRQYDKSGFEALDAEGLDKEIDLSNLETVNTVFATLFSKLGVPIKSTVSANVLEKGLNGTITIRPLPLWNFPLPEFRKKREYSSMKNKHSQEKLLESHQLHKAKFKLLYFEQDANGGYGLALQVRRGRRAASSNIILSIVGAAEAVNNVSRAMSLGVEFFSVSLIVNGSLSPKFTMFRKFCKGFPLSPLLFIIATKGFRAIIDKLFEIGFLKLQAVEKVLLDLDGHLLLQWPSDCRTLMSRWLT